MLLATIKQINSFIHSKCISLLQFLFMYLEYLFLYIIEYSPILRRFHSLVLFNIYFNKNNHNKHTIIEIPIHYNKPKYN